ncbi:type II toxin-antitoxin system RelE/ParE family toxin [Paraliobacillus sp. X-1268]|uniref:type II toxin-antitoxin system RelE/ParE family toxin n=1 Tax=Paraliobacillus sp. X-1268 TaxID=2213193 RepID=UPI000E3E1797|nr:plasmid maintenance system killer protein [Paraliobacillus sp. X-1268]
MNITYTSNKLENILTNPRLIKKEYTAFHKRVSNRMSELRAANNLDEITHDPPPRRHKLSGDKKECWGIDVSKNFRIVLRPVGEWDESDHKTIINIEILSIDNYH